jgi:hypothetical protein
VGLDVGVLGSEKPLGAVYRYLFCPVHVLATTVVALARQTFRVLVGEHASLSLHYRRRGEIFAGDEFQVAALTVKFLTYDSRHFRVRGC